MQQFPQSSQIHSLYPNNSLHYILLELDHKLGQISNIKNQIISKLHTDDLYNQHLLSHLNQKKYFTPILLNQFTQLSHHYKTQFLTIIPTILTKYHIQNTSTLTTIINYYQYQLKKCKIYYQQQILQLQQQIQRQYKVIATMKQQVQDLMILMKFKQQHNINQNNYQYQQQLNNFNQQNLQLQQHKFKFNNVEKRQQLNQLDIIQQQTQRTLQSSQRSQDNQGQPCQSLFNNFHKLQDKQFYQDQQISITQQKQNTFQTIEENPPNKQKLSHLINNQHSKQSQISQPNQQILTVDNYQQLFKKLTTNIDNGIQTDNICNTTPIFNLNFTNILQKTIQSTEQPKKPLPPLLNPQTKPPLQNWYSLNPLTQTDQLQPDHQQSIFFLDDEPQILNKTSKFNNISQKNIPDISHQPKNVSIKLPPQNIPTTNQPKHSLPQQSDLQPSHKKPNPITQQPLTQQHLPQPSQQKNKLKSQTASKQIKYNRQMSQQQTSEFILQKFNKVMNISQQFQTSASMPISNPDKLNQLHLNTSHDPPNHRNPIQSKQKTKQFLQQFRKTFNKCLSSIQTSKKPPSKLSTQKPSTKTNGTYPSNHQIQPHNIQPTIMTFGKSTTNSTSHRSLPIQIKQQNINTKNKQNGIPLSDKQNQKQPILNLRQNPPNIIKQPSQSSTKFITGYKKLELKYQGQKKNSIRSGSGILYYSNGLCYQGQFRQNLRNGYGTLKFNHIEIYTGTWINDQIQGQGRIRNCAIINKRKTTSSTSGPLGKWISYNGSFKNSKFDGQGTLHLQGGEKFVGNFVDGWACGQGSIYRKNGDLESGIWQNSVMVTKHLEK